MGRGERLLTNQAAQLLEGRKLLRQIPHVTCVGTGIYLGRWGSKPWLRYLFLRKVLRAVDIK